MLISLLIGGQRVQKHVLPTTLAHVGLLRLMEKDSLPKLLRQCGRKGRKLS
jgi:hypothetical protein